MSNDNNNGNKWDKNSRCISSTQNSVSPLSTQVIIPTYFIPRCAAIFLGVWTFETPVS
jgi:hypothetical protein